MTSVFPQIAIAFFGLAFSASASSQAASSATTKPPVVVELFTSQSCSSCPPAEALFRDIAARKDIVALEWHVDYWDDLRHGAAGRWKDRFSSPAHTRRQRDYNQQIRNQSGVYTPQIIVNGASETVGSRQDTVEQLIRSATLTPATISVSQSQGEGAVFNVKGAPGAHAYLAYFQIAAETRIGGGENNGRLLPEAHVVTRVENLGRISGASTRIVAEPANPGEGCALLVQDGVAGPILAASYCTN